MNFIHYNSYNLFDNTHACKNIYNELKNLVIITQESNYKASYKSPFFFL